MPDFSPEETGVPSNAVTTLIAKGVKEHLAQRGVEVKHTELLNAIARAFGLESANAMRALAEAGDPPRGTVRPERAHFFRTRYVVDVLAEETPMTDPDLAAVARGCEEGDCVGHLRAVQVTPLTEQEASEALDAAGSDPDFFGIGADTDEGEFASAFTEIDPDAAAASGAEVVLEGHFMHPDLEVDVDALGSAALRSLLKAAARAGIGVPAEQTSSQTATLRAVRAELARLPGEAILDLYARIPRRHQKPIDDMLAEIDRVAAYHEGDPSLGFLLRHDSPPDCGLPGGWRVTATYENTTGDREEENLLVRARSRAEAIQEAERALHRLAAFYRSHRLDRVRYEAEDLTNKPAQSLAQRAGPEARNLLRHLHARHDHGGDGAGFVTAKWLNARLSELDDGTLERILGAPQATLRRGKLECEISAIDRAGWRSSEPADLRAWLV